MARKKKEKSWEEKLNNAGYGNSSNLSQNQRSLTKEGKSKAKSKTKSGEKVKSAYKNTNIKYNTSPSSSSVTSTGRHDIGSNKRVTSNITKPSIRYSNVTGRGESKYKIGDLNPFSRGYSINNNITNKITNNITKENKFKNINLIRFSDDGRSDKEKYKDARSHEKDAVTDKDYKKYAKKGKEEDLKASEGATANNLTYSINKHKQNDSRKDTKTDVEKYSKYKFLKKNEINTYYYVLGKYGKEEAERYLTDIDQELEQRKADNETAQLKEIQKSTDNEREYNFKLLGYRASEAFKNAVSGLGLGTRMLSGNDTTESTKAGQLNREETVNTIKDKVTDEKGRQIYTDHNGNESAIYTEEGKKYLKDKDGNNIAVVVTDKKGNMYAADLDKNGNIKTNKKGQYYTYELNEKLKGNLSSIAMETAETVIDQTPQLVLGAVTGSEIVSLGAMGASVFGNSKNQALKEGKTVEQATKFATLSALKEIGSEKVLGFVPGINKENAGLFTKVLEKTVKPLANNRVVSKFIGQALEEGAEEVVGDMFEPLIERASYGKNVDKNGKEISLGESYRLKGKDVLKDMVIGTLSGAVMNTGSSVFSAVQRGNTTKAIQEMAKTSETESPKQLADELTFKETLENSKIQKPKKGRSNDITSGVGIIEGTLGYENGKFAESYSKNELINMFGENNTNKYLNEVKEIRSEQIKGVKKALEGVKNYKEWRDEARNGVTERDENGNIIRKTRTVGAFTERNRLKTETENTNLNAEIAKEFELSEDKGVLEYEKAIREGKNESELPYRLSENGVNNTARRDIKDILKVDTSNYNVGILKQAVDNINYNETNAGTEDIARAKYIIDNYDSIERNKVLDNDKGTLGLTLNKVIGDNHYIVEMAVNTSEGNIFITDVLKTDIDRGTTIDKEGLERQKIQDDFKEKVDHSLLIDALSEKVGLKVEYENAEESENGYISGDTVVINVNSDKSFIFTFGHELTHYIKSKSDKSYQSFIKVADKIIKGNSKYREQKVKTESIYKEAIESGRIVLNENENTEDYIHEEVIADFVGNVVFRNDEKAMRAIVKEDISTAQRIVEFFKSIHDTLKKVSKGEKGYKEAIQILKAEKAFNKAIGEIRGINALIGKDTNKAQNSLNKTAEEISEGKKTTDIKYSIQSDKDGNKYVKIDTDQDIFEGIAKKDYSKIAKMYMQDYLRGETVLSKDDKAIIGRKGINKYTNPGKRQFLFDKKMRLTPELKNVLKIAKKIEESDASKANSKYKNWEYYNFKFSIDDKNFSGIINIGIDENGNKHFYEINNIKEARLGGISGISPESTVPKSSFSINSISKEAGNSNGFSEKNNKKFSNKKYSLNENFTKDVREIIDKKSDKEYVKVYNGTPIPLMESGMKNYPMYMTRNHIISTVLTQAEAKEKGFPLRKGRNKRLINYHGLGEQGLIDSLSSLENPRTVYRYTDIDPKYNSDNFLIDTGLKDKDGNNIIVTARIADNRVILDEDDYNLITSAYGKNNYDSYIQKQLADKKIRVVYPRWSDIAGHNITEDNNPFNNSILENKDKVNKKHSISEETIRLVENSDNEIMKEMLNEIRSLTKRVEELNKNSNIERTETENINQAIIEENNKKVNESKEIPNIDDTVFDEVITTSKEKTQRVYNREVEKTRGLNKEAKKGLPTKEKREQIAKINQIKNADELIRYLEEQTKKEKSERESKKGENKKVPFNKFDKLRQQIFNSGHAFDKLSNIIGDNSVRDMYNSNLHSSQSAWGWLDKEQTDLWGNVTGKSVKDILEPIANEDKIYEFSDYLYHYLNIDRWKRGKALDEGVSENVSSIIVQNYEENNPVFKETANEVWEYYRNILDYNVQAGLVEKEFAEELKKQSPHYIPLSIEKFSNEFEYYKPHEDFNEIENPIKLAKGGSGFTSLTLIDKAMIRSANNTIKNARLNMLMNSVYDAVKANTDKTSDYVKIISEPVTEVEGRSGILISSVRIHANNIVTFGVNGFETKVKMQKDFIQGLNDLSSNQDYLADNVIAQALAKGVDYFKRLHTSYDPTFIIRNFFRDFQDALIWTDKPLEFVKKYPRAFREVKRGLGIGLTRKARNRGSRLWDLYVSLGAVGEVGVNEYSDFIDSKGNIRKGINKFAGNIEKLNLLIEQAARFDEFLRQLEKDGQLEKIQNSESLSKNDYNSLMNALYKADDITLNFQRGGKITKTANKYLIPFINPALQDFSKFVRNITAMDSWDSKDKKQILSSSVRFCAKATLLGLKTYAVSQLIGVIAEALTGDDDEKKKKLEKEMSSYTDYFKKSHFLIPIWDEEKKEYITIRIPKGRILGSIVNFTSDTIKDGFNIENYKNDLVYLWEQISPLETTAIWGTLTQAKNNVNYFGSPIVYDKYSELPDKDQYDDSTTSIAKKIGEITNISPMKIDYVLDQYSGVLGDVIMPFLATDGNTSLYYNSLTENTLTDVIGNMTKRLKVDTVYSNNTNSKYSNMKQKLTEDSAVEKRIEGNYGKTPTKAMIALVKANDSEISKLYTKKEQIYKNTKLSNNEKREKCREIQIKINKYKEATLEEVEAIRPELEKAYKENYKNAKKKYDDKAYGKVYSSDVANALVKKVKTEHAGKLALNMLYPTSDNLDDTDGSDKYNNGESIKNCKILKKAGVSYLEQAEYQVYVNKYKYKKKTEVSYEERAKKFKNKLKSLKNLNTSERNLLYMSTYKYNFNGNAKRYEVYGNVKYDVAMYLAKNKNLTTAQRAKIAKNAGYEIIKEGKDTYITW
ncbi:LPD38 domain-containing protein [Anaerofustis stercorihominis]|uniref:Large polyvalent protein associated domain-containing protein n=1 Tax=Anaerofustis stercorihominis TaxID=214853 RepID=A0A3E3DX21_9FIRM|nr:LPD38 domain-containing protein [Anaerofustis stercorihominis]RGD73814.1 hypothetical protein DW687_08540 [Anaerofustis stercorihominis]